MIDNKRSFGAKHPILVTEWNTKKNGQADPYHIFSSSRLKVWWVCKEHHEWVASVYKRVEGRGCPFCYKASFAKINPLSVFKNIVSEWHPTKNGKLIPNNFSANSAKKIWWQCSFGHEWEARISSRAISGCPICAGKKLVAENSLAIEYPNIAAEWHPIKNDILTPFDVSSGSGRIVWWKCFNGHEWKAAVYSRKDSGCSQCKGYIIRSQKDIYSVDKKKKICKSCNKMLKISLFRPMSNTRDNSNHRYPLCNKCAAESNRQYRLTDKAIISIFVFLFILFKFFMVF